MSAGLHPTPTRRALLADVEAGEVYRMADGIALHLNGRRITAAMAEMQAAGWVEPLGRGVDLQQWVLTSAGREALWLQRQGHEDIAEMLGLCAEEGGHGSAQTSRRWDRR